VLKRISNLWRRPRVATIDELRDLLSREALYLSQKATIDYCRARAGLGWHSLVSEPDFVAALDACRWQAMVAVLGDAIVVTEGFLRSYVATEEPRLATALTATFSAILDSSPAPDDARARWHTLPDEIAARLARAQMGPAHNAADIAKTSGALVFELLPIHPSVRIDDRDIVVNSIRFGMVAFSETLARAVGNPAELARRLTASASP
jgi:hypothetical protein